MGAQFVTTQWSQVLAARDGADTEARQALSALCEAYWYPLYAFVRRQGYSAEKSRDLTQSYFAYLLDREILGQVDPAAGRFRSFLLATLKNFLSHEREKASALKRGGGAQTVSMDAVEAEDRYHFEPGDDLTPEQIFERRWALTVVERSLERLQQETSQSAQPGLFHHLKGSLTGERPRTPYRDVATKLGMTEGAVRGTVYRMRRRLGRFLREEIGQTVADPDEIDAEVKHLLMVIGPWEPQGS